MEAKRNLETFFPEFMETNTENRDNLNTSLTALTINDQNTEITRNNEADSSETINIPTKTITIPIRELPVRNVPEKIILCLDTGVDSEFTPFKIEQGTTYTPLYMLKRVIELFVQNKCFIDSRHEYALMTIEKKNVKWIKDFSNNPNNIISGLHLKDLNENEVTENFDLSCVLDTVCQNVVIPKAMDPLHLPPPYVVRLIILYSRSFCTFADRKNFEELLNNPYFTVDVILTNENISISKNHHIFNCLQKLDEKLYSYKFEVGRNVTMLHDCMAKLLAHPLQRPVQTLASYEINQDAQMNFIKVDKEE